MIIKKSCLESKKECLLKQFKDVPDVEMKTALIVMFALSAEKGSNLKE